MVTPPQSPGSSTAQLDFEQVLRRPAYVTALDEFVTEKDPQRALLFWLNEYTHPGQIQQISDIRAALLSAIAELDQVINEQLNAILHHPRFQKLEASWRGIWYLTQQIDGIKSTKLKLMDITWAEVSKDIGRSMEFDQSQLFNKIYNEEYGTPGGEPYGVLIGDYEISHKPSNQHPYDDVATLEGLAQIAAAAFSPFIASASAEMFGLDRFSELRLPLNLQAIFAQSEYVRWRALRNKPDARFIGLTLPKVLMRPHYRTTPGNYKGIFFQELPTEKGRPAYLWGNAAYAFASVLLREFINVGWFGHIRGVPRDHLGGGLVTNLTLDTFATDPNGVACKPVTDVVITDSIERDISNLGFIPLCQCYGTPFVAFYSNSSIQITKRQSNKEAEVNAKLAAMMQHVLCGSRMAHYIKVMIRDKIGSFLTAKDCEDFLRRWLYKYTTGRDDLEWEAQARYPLREAAVKVREHPERPGQYLCVIHLVPHYQADQMVSELELVTELVQSGNN